MRFDNNQKVFIELMRAGLWEKEVQLSQYENIDYKCIYKIAEEQSVVGLVSAGFEHVKDVKAPQEDVLAFVASALQIEQRNTAMNHFVADLIKQFQKQGVYPLLVKGQGIAQCYERPLWRMSGDIDLLIENNLFESARCYLKIIADYAAPETLKNISSLHQEFHIGQWIVELHGTLHSNLSKKIDEQLDIIQRNAFLYNERRIWHNNNIEVFLPSPNVDVIFLFLHILQHFFKGGIGLRQLCDLSRLLFNYKNVINTDLLRSRLEDMGIVSEWKAFSCVLVNYLGLPSELMPLYDYKYIHKGESIMSYILYSGNFGHNKDYSYITKQPPFIRKITTFMRQAKDSFMIARTFPLDAILFLLRFLKDGVKAMIK